jgi:hypothetical protein
MAFLFGALLMKSVKSMLIAVQDKGGAEICKTDARLLELDSAPARDHVSARSAFSLKKEEEKALGSNNLS